MKIEKEVENLKFIGNSEKLKDGSILLNGKLIGSVEVECVKCLKPFKKEINEEVKFKVVKPPFNGFDENYDIIEQEKFDIKEILKSEINSIKNDYNICKECEDKEFNEEF